MRDAPAASIARDTSVRGVAVASGERIAGRAVLLAVGPATARSLVGRGGEAIGTDLVASHAACLDLGVTHPPGPGYVVSLDDPLYVTVQSPPAHQAPEGQAVVAAIRYGARSAQEDRPNSSSWSVRPAWPTMMW